MPQGGVNFLLAQFLTATALLVCKVNLAITINTLAPKGFSSEDAAVSETSAVTTLQPITDWRHQADPRNEPHRIAFSFDWSFNQILDQYDSHC